MINFAEKHFFCDANDCLAVATTKEKKDGVNYFPNPENWHVYYDLTICDKCFKSLFKQHD